MKKENALGAIIALLLALIVKAALETMFKPIFEGNDPWSELLSLHGAQLAVLFILLLRFYLGAYRIAQMEPNDIAFPVRAMNFVFAFVVFSTFYTIALSVTKSGYYFTLMVALHTIDAILLGIGHVLTYIADDRTQPGEITLRARRKIVFTFFALSVVTVAYAFISYSLLGARFSDPSAVYAHSLFLIFLLLLSLFDLWLLRDFYFRYARWADENTLQGTTRPAA
jgi:hypothetical protein